MANGELRSASAPSSGRISGSTFAGRWVQYVELDGVAIFEGDIALGRVEDIQAYTNNPEVAKFAAKGVAIKGDQYHWPNGTVAYEIDPALPSPQRARDAIAHWQAHTPIKFVERTTGNANQHRDYVFFTSQSGCWSEVGRRGGKQLISLGAECTAGNAIHEIGHSVGLWHEQSREDRVNFVTIAYQNIVSGYEHNFDQHVTDGDDIGSYDYGSIMHYPATAFSKNGQPTIITKTGAQIGQRAALSVGDIAAVQALYDGQ